MAGRGAKASGAVVTIQSRNSFEAVASEPEAVEEGIDISYAAAAATATTGATEPTVARLLAQALEKIRSLQEDLVKRLEPVPSSTPSGATKLRPINKGDTASLAKDLADLGETLTSAHAQEEKRAAEKSGSEVRALVKSVTQLTATLNAKQGQAASSQQTRASDTPRTPPTQQQQANPKELAAAQRNAEPRITLNVHHLDLAHPARTEPPPTLLTMIGPVLSRAKEVRVMSVGRMQSGDLRIALSSKEEETKLLDDEDEGWLSEAFTGQKTTPAIRRPLFPVHQSAVAHGVPFWLEEDGIAEDVMRVNGVEVTAARFFKGRRQRQELQKKYNRQFGSVVIAFRSAGDRDKFVQAGPISCGNSRCIVATKDHKCAQCPAASTDGPAAKCDHKRSCCLCGGEHASNDDRCPKRQAWREARRITHQHNPTNQQ